MNGSSRKRNHSVKCAERKGSRSIQEMRDIQGGELKHRGGESGE